MQLRDTDEDRGTWQEYE